MDSSLVLQPNKPLSAKQLSVETAWPYQDLRGQAVPRSSSTTEMTPEELNSVWISQYWCYQTLPELSRLFTRPALLLVFCCLITHWQLDLNCIPASGPKMWASSSTLSTISSGHKLLQLPECCNLSAGCFTGSASHTQQQTRIFE